MAGRKRPAPQQLAQTRSAWLVQAFLAHHGGKLSGAALRDLIRKTRGA